MDRIPYLVKDDFFNEEELSKIWEEIEFLTDKSFLIPSESMGYTQTPDGKMLKRNRGVYLTQIYDKNNIHSSPIIECSKKIHNGLLKEYESIEICNRAAKIVRHNHLLVSYYGDGDHYKPHHDMSVVTVLYWLCKTPKAFDGGDLIFNDTNEVVEMKNNRMLIFPSWALHSVTPVKMNSDDEKKGRGRYCISHFLHE